MTKTNVHFRAWPCGDIIALFPDVPHGISNLIMSYEHTGQHGGATPELIDTLKKASRSEYADMAVELASIGYDLNIIE